MPVLGPWVVLQYTDYSPHENEQGHPRQTTQVPFDFPTSNETPAA
jgi:hypothetical protein